MKYFFALLVFLCTLACQAADEQDKKQDGLWAIAGGEIGFRFNHDLLRQLGIKLNASSAKRIGNYLVLPMLESSELRFSAPYGSLTGFVKGRLQSGGDLQLQWRNLQIDLNDFSLRPKAGDALALELVDRQARAWFYIKPLMHEWRPGEPRFQVHTMDLRIAPLLAKALGEPRLAGLAIADLRLSAFIRKEGLYIPPAQFAKSCAVPNWPNTGNYRVDVLLEGITAQMMRCGSPAAATGTCNGDSSNNLVVFAPDSALRNSDTDNTAEVPWYTKFSGNFAPYGNDQHPFLIWNMYRVDGAGRLEQIGRSGLKHAFATVNSGCADICVDSHILGRRCGDEYTTGNNDLPDALGPRSEVIAARGIWGRCGSIYDPDCNGEVDPSGNDGWDYRLIVRENDITPAFNIGAQYYFDSWYVVRDDVDIYNTMGYIQVTPQAVSPMPPPPSPAPRTWLLPAASSFTTGAVINQWVAPGTASPTMRNNELANHEGHARLAVKVTDLGSGDYRYDYALMNFDFARAATSGSEPNLRVLENKGFAGFKIPVSALTTVNSWFFSDGDRESANDWIGETNSAVESGGQVAQFVPPTGVSLDWGSLYSFSFIANARPITSTAYLPVARAGTPAYYQIATLGPDPLAGIALFHDGFED